MVSSFVVLPYGLIIVLRLLDSDQRVVSLLENISNFGIFVFLFDLSTNFSIVVSFDCKELSFFLKSNKEYKRVSEHENKF